MENKEQQNTSIRFQNCFAFKVAAEKRKTFAAKTVKAEYEEFEITAFYAGNRKRKLNKDYSLTGSCRYRVYVVNQNTKARTWFECSAFQNGIQTEKMFWKHSVFFLQMQALHCPGISHSVMNAAVLPGMEEALTDYARIL